MRVLFTTVAATAILLGTSPDSAEAKSGTIRVVNELKQTAKFCYYNPGDIAMTVALECTTIGAGRTGSVKHKVKGYRVRVFSPGVPFDIRICQHLSFNFPPAGHEIRIVGGVLCVIAIPSKSSAAPTPAPAPAPTPSYQVGDAVLIGLRDNPQIRQMRYFPAVVTGADAGNGYRFRQLNGREGRLRADLVRRDTVGEGTRVLAKPINERAYQYAIVKERRGHLLRVAFNNGSREYVDMKDIKLESDDVPAQARPGADNPSWVIRMCNGGSDPLYGAAAFRVSDRLEVSYGWHKLAANSCSDVPVGDLVLGMDDWQGQRQGVYVYAERRQAGGMVRRPAFKAPANARHYCISTKEQWSINRSTGQGVVWAHCNETGERLVPMAQIKLPKGGGIVTWQL